MHALTGILVVVGAVAAAGEPSGQPAASAPGGGAARGAAGDGVPEALQALAVSPWSVDLDLGGGMLAIPTPADLRRSFVDRHAGVRAGYRRALLGPVRVGGELALRGTRPAAMGSAPLAPFQVLYFLGRPSSTVRQATTLAAGGTLGLRLAKADYYLEPMALLGVSGTMRTKAVMLDLPLPYGRNHPTLGGYVGMALATGLQPLLLRLDLLFTHEVGPPPFTHRVFQSQFNVSAGLRF